MPAINLIEYQPLHLPADALSTALGERLWREYDRESRQIRVEFPGPPTGGAWRLTALGWVGSVPLTRNLMLRILPKTPLRNLFQMWAYAYRLNSFQLPPGLADCASLEAFYAQLAHVLAQRVLDRARLGLHRTYVPHRQTLPYVRGQLDLRAVQRRPVQAVVPCRYTEHTADIADNQILAYTLGLIARSGRCDRQVQTSVRRAYRTLQRATTPRAFGPEACDGRVYSRLNADYQPLHALCRFFLEHSGPRHDTGDRRMLPFLVDMSSLFERFVAEWLRAHVPAPWQVQAQKRVTIGPDEALHLDIDLVLRDGSGRVHSILDTKYKTPDKPATADVSQVVTYAEATGCREAVLLYPAPLRRPLDVQIGAVRVRSLTFDLSTDLEAAGQALLPRLADFRSV